MTAKTDAPATDPINGEAGYVTFTEDRPDREKCGKVVKPLDPARRIERQEGGDSEVVLSPSGWWDEYGGALDVRSGVVYNPQGNHKPPCKLPGCILPGCP